ncbi:MAG: hypothetical protein EON55_04045, partial [Alphaproteobacteria bacterium]
MVRSSSAAGYGDRRGALMPSAAPAMGETQGVEISAAPGATTQGMHEEITAGRIPEDGTEQHRRERPVEAAGIGQARLWRAWPIPAASTGRSRRC